MSYILAVNPDILSAASMDRGGRVHGYSLGSIFGHVGDGYFGEITFCLGSGYGGERFFAFTLVQGMGYSWESALAAVFLSRGWCLSC